MNFFTRTEEEWLEFAKQFFDRWKFHLGAVIILPLVFGSAFSYYQYSSQQVIDSHEKLYEDFASTLQQGGDSQGNLAGLKAAYNDLMSQPDSANARAIRLQMASLSYELEDAQLTEEIYAALMQDSDPIAHMARLRLVRIKLFDEQMVDQAQTILDEQSSQTQAQWPALFAELKGDIEAFRGNDELAAERWTEALELVDGRTDESSRAFAFNLERKLQSFSLVKDAIQAESN